MGEQQKKPSSLRYYIIMGLVWAAITYGLVTVVEYFSKGGFDMNRFLIGIPFWAVAGIIFAFVIRAIESKRKQKEDNKS